MSYKESLPVLVTGGAGFIGSNLIKSIIQSDARPIICLDNFSTGRRSNVLRFKNFTRFSVMEHDVKDHLDLAVSEIWHLACPASPPAYQKDPVDTIKTSVFGASNLLELARRNNCRIFFASTSEVYGNPLVHPQPEGYFGNVNPIGPRACYDEGKRCAETLFFDYHRTFGLSIKVVRIFNTYGPNMDPSDGRVVSNFIVQALRGAPLTVYGSGEQTRSFCFVDDLISGFRSFMDSPEALPGPLNLGNPAEYSMLELAETILRITGSSSKISFVPLPVDDPERRKPDISQAARNLGWTPKVSLEEGIGRTVKYFRDELEVR